MPLPSDATQDVAVLPGTDEARRPVFCVLLKRSFRIVAGGVAERLERARPLVKIDEYYDHGDAEWAPVKYETDLLPYKVATDFVVIGAAMAPGEEPVEVLDVAVSVGEVSKEILVFGDRRCIAGGRGAPEFTDPEPFTRLEIRYDRAYGGFDRESIPGLEFAYPRNPIGRGFVLRNKPELVEGMLLPNLEDPENLLTPERVVLEDPEGWVMQPLPQGFGWFHRAWYPRSSFAGAIPGFVDPDVELEEERLGLVPPRQIALARRFKLPAFDVRFNNGASPGLAVPYLQGGEEVVLRHLTPEGLLRFRLPEERPRIALDIGTGMTELEVVMHTACVRVDDGELDIVWRGALPYPGVEWLPEMKRLDVEVSG
jgi:hypothetical protein